MEGCSPGVSFPDCPLLALLAVEGVPCTGSSWMDSMLALGGGLEFLGEFSGPSLH